MRRYVTRHKKPLLTRRLLWGVSLYLVVIAVLVAVLWYFFSLSESFKMFLFTNLILGIGWYLVRKWVWNRDYGKAIENASLEQNASRTYILHTLKLCDEVEMFGKQKWLILRGRSGYNVEWRFSGVQEYICFKTFINDNKEAEVRQMYKEWNATLDTKEKFGYGLQLQFLYAEGTSRDETLEGLCLLVFSVEMDVSKVNLSLESLLLKMKSLMESCSPFFAHRKFYLQGRSRFGMHYEMGMEYFGLTLLAAEKKTRQEIVDIYDELPADDFACLDECLTWLDAQRLPYIESWEDMEDS